MKPNCSPTAIAATAAWLFLSIGPIHAAEAVRVKTVLPVRGDIHRFVTLPGTLRANQRVTLCAKVPGYLKSIAADKGDRVEAGQTLAVIEAPELVADLTRYKAEVKVAEIEFERIHKAQETAPDLVIPQSADEAQSRLEIAKANLERTQVLLDYTKITAPFSGIVTDRFADPGAFIPAATSGTAAGTAAILTISDFNTVRAQVPVPEMEAAKVRVGQPVTFTVEGLAGRLFQATVSRISYALDEATRTMLVEADVPNADLDLRPGMYATVKIGLEKHADALLIPIEALLLEKSGASVFTSAGGKAKKLAVKAGFNDGKSIEILDGLDANQPVILLGKTILTDERPVNAEEAGK